MATTTKTAGRKAKTKRKASTKRKATTKRKAATKTRRKASTKAKSGPAAAISKTEFKKKAELLQVQVLSEAGLAAEFDLDPREFSSGSFGWFASEKVSIPVGGTRVRCQMSVNLTVIGSKNAR